MVAFISKTSLNSLHNYIYSYEIGTEILDHKNIVKKINNKYNVPTIGLHFQAFIGRVGAKTGNK